MAKYNDWKERLNVVYSTNPDFSYTFDEEETETQPKQQQKLRVQIDTHRRGGKTAPVLRGSSGTDNDLKELAKWLKTRCGVGGSAKDGEIIIQGELREKIIELLQKDGYTQTR